MNELPAGEDFLFERPTLIEEGRFSLDKIGLDDNRKD
ncbi:hypothetical protein AQ1_00304 [alpha proteobacterium Q-1]|nr:hypothetical protein AQ1_00304 [alpha proteobacterium Q-1]